VVAADDGASASAAAAALAESAAAAARPELSVADRLGAQLLEACASRRAADALRLLAAGGVNLDARDAAGRSALMLASEDESGALDGVAARLIASGAGLNFNDENDGATALVKACAKRRAATALLLVKAGAELDAVDVGEEEHMTALDYACARGLGDVAQAIYGRRGRLRVQVEAAHAVELAEAEYRRAQEENMREHDLAAAALAREGRYGQEEVLRMESQAWCHAVLEREAAMKKEKAAAEATLRAVAAAVVVTARNRVARDADEINAAKVVASEATARANAAAGSSTYRGPAADSALGERLLDVVALVSANGFALDARPTRFICGLTFRLGARRADGSLDRAGYIGAQSDMILWSLRLQAPWLEAARRAPRKASRTSLMVAASEGNVQRVRELLAAGAPVACVDAAKRTALHFACAAGDKQCVAMLVDADAAGVTINARSQTGATPLMTASAARHEHAVRALLARDARPEVQDENGFTALHFAAQKGHASVAALLCAAPGGAEALRTQAFEGWSATLKRATPLRLAEGGVSMGRLQLCAAVLRASGAEG
jgi:ankyrin repeat protein